MTFFESIFLGIVQGITEFLPISSSGHLILMERWLDLRAEDLKSFDVALHMGTLVAILLYFWRDFAGILFGIFGKSMSEGRISEEYMDGGNGDERNITRGVTVSHSQSVGYYHKNVIYYRKLLLFLMIGTLPAILVGVFLGGRIDAIFRDNSSAIAINLFLVALLFFLAERVPKEKKKSEVVLKEAIFIGVAQAVALVPGVSRSGATISAGLFQGIRRESAARFSFLLGAPAIFGAGIWTFIDGFESFKISLLLGGFFASAISGLLVIHFLMGFLKRYSLAVFAWYRIGLAIVIFLL